MAHQEMQKRKKKRPPSCWIKKFSDAYQSTNEYLGQGASGTVRTFYSVEKRKEFAVKIIKKNGSLNRVSVLKEIEILHHCRGQENIVQLQEFYEEDLQFYLIFEKMEGGTLLDKLTKDGPLPEIEVSKIIRGLANSLKFLHGKAVAHRDVKLENILCTSEANIHPVKLCDFDLSTEFSAMCIGRGESGSEGSTGSPCSSSSSPLHNFASAVGSADYMAPEVVSVWLYESDNYTEQCDLWSLGVVMFILLSGLKPFVARRPDTCVCVMKDEDYQCEYCKEEHFECIKRGRYEMSGPEWSLISQGAKDLIGKLLVVDPTLRYTPDQVLAHPWIVDPLSFRQHVSAPIPCLSASKLKRIASGMGSGLNDPVNSKGGESSRPSSWLSDYCGSEEGDQDHWIFVDQFDLNEEDHDHRGHGNDNHNGHGNDNLSGIVHLQTEVGGTMAMFSSHRPGGVLPVKELKAPVCDGFCGVSNNISFDKTNNDNNDDSKNCHSDNKRDDCDAIHHPPLILSPFCPKRELQFGSCDSGNVSGVSLTGSLMKII